jgi:hypothetical protein
MSGQHLFQPPTTNNAQEDDMTTTSKAGSRPPPPPPEKTGKTNGKKDDKNSDSTDQDNLNQAIDSLSIMMLQKIINGAKQRRAEMKEDDPDAF